MKKGSTLFLRILIALMALGVAGFALIVIPSEVRWEDFKDLSPFTLILFVVYASIIPFYSALYQAWKLLNFIDANTAFAQESVNALKIIKYSGVTFSLLYALLLPILFIIAQSEDAPGVAAIGIVFVIASGVIATLAAILQRLLQEAINIKSENDLTV